MLPFVVSALLAAGNARADTFQSVGPVLYGDDFHSASLTPYPTIAVSSILSPAGQCTWINAGLDAFIAANPANGSGPSHEAWSYTWAEPAVEAQVEAGLKVLDYYPYVVTPPAITYGDGNIPEGAKGELGGAVLNLEYKPVAGGPVIKNLHWIQAYTGTIYGKAFDPVLDNDSNFAYTGQGSKSPFYDTEYIAGTLENGDGYFVDRPKVVENEYEQNPVASIQFQAVLVDDNRTFVNGVVQNNLTLYGGAWWGFNYTAVDTPEPSACAFLGAGALGAGGFLRRRYVRRRPLARR